MLSYSSPTQARFPTLDILSENDDQTSDLSFSTTGAHSASKSYTTFKYGFLVIFSPIWIILSFVLEVLIVPLNITCHFIKQSCQKWYLAILVLILSPLIYVAIMVISCLFSPVSIATKCYGYITENNFFSGLVNLLYPEKHPIFDSWLNQNSKYDGSYKKNRYLSSAETQKSHPTPDDHFMNYKAFYLSPEA